MTEPHEPSPLPETCSVAFKEWAGVCAALERGRQTIILRKGGVAEGPGGFAPEHPVFWLYPTHVHEAEQGLRVTAPPASAPRAGEVELAALARVELVALIERPESLRAFDDLHVWTTETLAKRFHYRRPGLWLLGVRVYRRNPPWPLAVTAEHAGCKTWVPLEPLATTGLQPVLSADEFDRRIAALRQILTREAISEGRS